MRRNRKAKIVATLGPASSDLDTIRSLFMAGADVFRLNFSHGTHAQHRERYEHIREIERQTGRPIAVLMDLQGPKLRIGTFQDGAVVLAEGQTFQLDLRPEPGCADRVQMPHPEIFAALSPGMDLLLDDGKLRLRVLDCDASHARTTVVTGGRLSERKGVNVPSALLPISALTDKDRLDLMFGLDMGVDWVALSFVQRPKDIEEVKAIVQGRAGVLAKLEKPTAVDDHLEAIIDVADAVMVARGDMGVELPAERVPRLQRQIVSACRKAGKPVIVATQMLESMVSSPVPTRAEASDVAGAIYEGADAVMLSAESASGKYPLEAVAIMDRIISDVESDPAFQVAMDASHSQAQSSVNDAICQSLRVTASVLPISAVVTYTRSGATSLSAARERPASPIVSLTPDAGVARRMALAWGVHSVCVDTPIQDVPDMVELARRTVLADGFASAADYFCVSAGSPFGTVGSTNFMHIAKA